MFAVRTQRSTRSGLDLLRVELADLAYDLERRGRLDAADVVMMLHARVREIAEDNRPDTLGSVPVFVFPPIKHDNP